MILLGVNYMNKDIQKIKDYFFTLDCGTQVRLNNRGINIDALRNTYIQFYRMGLLGGSLSEPSGFVKFILDSNYSGDSCIARTDKNKPFNEENTVFEGYGSVLPNWLVGIDSVPSVDLGNVIELSKAIGDIRRIVNGITTDTTKRTCEYLSKMDTSVIGETASTKDLPNAIRIASIIQRTRACLLELTAISEALSDTHVYYR